MRVTTPRIIYLPIEEIPSRYGQMMNQEIKDQLTVEERKICDHLTPAATYGVIGAGNFLDTVKTSIYKASQLELLLLMIGNGDIHKGDIIFLHDIFYPGMEAIKYVSELTDLDLKTAAFNYAGRADPHDFVQKLGNWADFCEKGWHKACDWVFVGSEFHKNQILWWGPPLLASKLKVTGYPYNPKYQQVKKVDKQDVCIWPHRICVEKGLMEFRRIAAALPEVKFLVSSGGAVSKEDLAAFKVCPNITVKHKQTKEQYHTHLAKAKWFLSTAKQETFGYALHEAADAGCIIIAADNACNPEFVPKENLFQFDAALDNVPVKRLLEIMLGRGPTKLLDSPAKGSAKEIVSILRGNT